METVYEHVRPSLHRRDRGTMASNKEKARPGRQPRFSFGGCFCIDCLHAWHAREATGIAQPANDLQFARNSSCRRRIAQTRMLRLNPRICTHRLDQPGRKPIDYCLMDPLYLNISCVRTCSLCVWHVAEVRRPEANAAEYGGRADRGLCQWTG